MKHNELSSLFSTFGTRCLTQDMQRAPYEIPERGEPGHATAVLLVQSEAEVAQALEIANENGLQFVLSAGRTGLVEAQRPQGEVVLSLERLRRLWWLELKSGDQVRFEATDTIDTARDRLFSWWEKQGKPDLDGSTITVEAGIAVDALNDVLGPLGRMFPMEMGSSAAATVGACVANASAGANAVCYGTAAHMAKTASGFWGNASQSGVCKSARWQRAQPENLAIDSTALPPDWGLIGSQGALGVITRVCLRTQAMPRSREAVLLAVKDMPEAMAYFAAATQTFGTDVEEFEFLSRSAIELVMRRMGAAVRLPFEQMPDAAYFVLLQIKSASEDDELASRLYEFCASTLDLVDEQIGYAPLAALKKIRHSVTESSNLEMRALGGGRLSFDTATPVVHFGEYLAQLASQIKSLRPDIQLVDFGHAGVGGAHLHLIGGAGKPVAVDADRLIDLVFDVTSNFGGTFSAEHGVGPKWADQFLRRMSPDRLNLLLARKRKLDPRNVLSPRSFGLDVLLAREPGLRSQ